jgi:hypothetical protein
VLMADAAEQAGVRRFVQISSMGRGRRRDVRRLPSSQDRARGGPAPPRPGLDGAASGGLTNTPGTARVRLAASLPRGQISRVDVAAVIAGLVTDARASARLWSSRATSGRTRPWAAVERPRPAGG